MNDDAHPDHPVADRARALYRDIRAGAHAIGYLEGLEAGRREAIHLVLTARFGPLADHVCTRIEQATSYSVLRWLDRVLTAASVDDALDGE